MADVEYVRVLSVAEVELYLSNVNIDARQNVICGAMMSTVIVHDKSIYFFDILGVYFKKISEYSAQNLTSLITQFIGCSIALLEHNDMPTMKRLAIKYPKQWLKLQECKITDLGSYKLKLSLPPGTVFDADFRGIHFTNGRFDLPSGTFNPRAVPRADRSDSFISQVLPYDWAPSTPPQVADLYQFLLKTFTSDAELHYVLYLFACASRCDTSGCSCLFHVGLGGSGKSTLMNVVTQAFGLYAQVDLTSDMFDSRAVANRVLSEVRITSRFLIVSELNSKKKDASAIKAICDGEIATTKLYKGGAFMIPIMGKLFCTSNNVIAFDNDDTGIARRVMYCLHTHRFTNVAEDVNNVDVFMEVPDLKTIDTTMKLTVFNLIATYATDEFRASIGAHPVPPPAIKTGDSLIDINAFLQAYFLYEVDAVVPKNTVIGLSKSYYTRFEMSDEYLISKITSFNGPAIKIMYDKNRTVAGTKGVFVNMRIKE